MARYVVERLAAKRTQGTPLYTHAARGLLGGEAGKRIVAEADAFFVARGVVEPKRLVDALIPGYG